MAQLCAAIGEGCFLPLPNDCPTDAPTGYPTSSQSDAPSDSPGDSPTGDSGELIVGPGEVTVGGG